MHRSRAAGNSPPAQAPQPLSGPSPLPGPPPGSSLAPPPQISAPQAGQSMAGQSQAGQPGLPLYGEPDRGSFRDPAASAGPALPSLPAAPPARDLPAAQHGAPGSAPVQAHLGRDLDLFSRQPAVPACRTAGPPPVAPPPASGRSARPRPRPPYAPPDSDASADPAAGQGASAQPGPFTTAPPNLPGRRDGYANGRHADGMQADGPPVPLQVSGRTPGGGQHGLHAASRFL